MKYGVTLPNIGASSDPRVVADLAVEVERRDWDGVFVWDCVYIAETQQPEERRPATPGSPWPQSPPSPNASVSAPW